jgi:ferric-dicitrate binding protein FerR (iron transport regulator)
MHIPWELLKKYVLNELSEEEGRSLQQWSNASELNKNIFQEVISDDTFKEALISGKWDDTTRNWEAVLSRLESAAPRISFTKKYFYRAAALAASLLILVGLGIGSLYYYIQNRGYSDTDFTYIYSPRGQRTQVILPDSSKVWLNSETSIRYPVSFNRKSREVTIIGEAFFKVKKNPDKPFYVNTSDVKVKVYGTSFNVKAYPNEKYIETTLIEGKLSVIPKAEAEIPANEIFLHPNDKLKFKRPGFIDSINVVADKQAEIKRERKEAAPKMLLSRNIDTSQENLWKDGKLVFLDERFGDMAIKLERWYDVRIHFENEKIKDFRFTGQFDKETINQAMEALKISSQHCYHYEMVFRDIYLK